MGERKRRRDKFLAEHPFCFFCARPVATIDHVPSRNCFRGRVGPEGFEFPACERCNRGAGPLEQVVSLYIYLGNHDEVEPNQAEVERLVRGVRNNNPQYLPNIDLSANYKRRAMREIGMTLPPGSTYADAPVAEAPTIAREAFRLFERRLLAALFYKHMHSVLPLKHTVRTEYFHIMLPTTQRVVESMTSMIPNLVLGARQNTDIGDQFLYRWYGNTATREFAYLAQFSASYFFSGGASPRPLDPNDFPEWEPHSVDVATIAAMTGTIA